MKKRGKRYEKVAELVENTKNYSVDEAIELVGKTASANFDETVEVHIKLDVDSSHADQQVRGAVVLPNGTGKTKTILVFAEDEKAEEAKEAGADFVGANDMVEKIKGGWLDFDIVVATPNMMSLVGKLGRTLGPKGLMPNPKAGTVTMDIAKTVDEIKKGKVEYRLDKTNNIHISLGKVSFGEEKLKGNFDALLDAVKADRPAAVKGRYIESVTLSSTMGPGISIDPFKVDPK